MTKKKIGGFLRECRKCGKMFRRIGKYEKLCKECRTKSYSINGRKNKRETERA